MLTKLLSAVLATLVMTAEAIAEEVLLVTVDYPPYYGPELVNEGPITEIVTQAFENVGYAIKVDYMPWARAMQQAKVGKADGLLGAWYSDERTQWFAYSMSLPGNELVLFKRRGAPPPSFTSYDDLKPYRIGIVRGYRNPPEFEAAELRTEIANSDKVNLIKLANERLDLILVDRAVAKHIVAKELPQYTDELVSIEPPLEVLPLYLLISRKTEDYQRKLDDFNRGLAILEKDGGVQAILKRHGL